MGLRLPAGDSRRRRDRHSNNAPPRRRAVHLPLIVRLQKFLHGGGGDMDQGHSLSPYGGFGEPCSDLLSRVLVLRPCPASNSPNPLIRPPS